MNPFGNSGSDDFFGADFFGGDFFGGSGMGRGGPMGGMGGGMGGPMGDMGVPMGGDMGRGGPGMGVMGGNMPERRRAGYSITSSYDSTRPEGQQYQEQRVRLPDYDGGAGGDSRYEPTPRGGSGRGLMFSGLSRSDNPFRRQVNSNPAGGYNPSVQEEPRYHRTYRRQPQYEEYEPRGQEGGRPSRYAYPQQTYYEDELDSDSGDEGPSQRQSYAPQQSYGGGGGGSGGVRRTGGGSGGGRLFNYDRNGRRPN